MPRPQRLPPIPFAWYYVALYSRDGRSLVKNSADLKVLLDLLGATLMRKGAHLHAGCVLSTEIHLAIQSGEAPVSEITRGFCHDYALRFNRIYGERGRLFRAHPRVLLIQHRLWLVPLVHVIHWIPQLHQLHRSAGDEYWNSDAVYRGRERREGLITHAVLHMVSHGARSRDAQQNAYRRRFDPAPGTEDIRLLLIGSPSDSRVLGDAEFLRETWLATHQRPPQQGRGIAAIGDVRPIVVHAVEQFAAVCDVALSRRQTRAWKRVVTLEQLCSRSRKRPLPTIRALIASYLIARHIATRTQAARFFGCRPKTLSIDRRRRAETLFVKWFGVASDALFSTKRDGGSSAG